MTDFSLDIDSYLSQESTKHKEAINNESVSSTSLHHIVRYYLDYYGYVQTLREFDSIAKPEKLKVTPVSDETRPRKVSIKLAETLALVDEPGKCGICMNECEVATCRDCVRHLIGTVETGRIRLPIQSSCLYRRNSSWSDDLPKERSDSIDLSSVYMKDKIIELPLSDSPSDYYESLARVELRGDVRRLIMKGEVTSALELVLRHFPTLVSSKSIFSIHVQYFIELIRSRRTSEALQFARETLGPIRSFDVICRNEIDIPLSVSEIIGLLCYETPESSVLSFLLSQEQRDLTADVINAAMLESEGSSMSCYLSRLLQQYLATLQLYQSSQSSLSN